MAPDTVTSDTQCETSREEVAAQAGAEKEDQGCQAGVLVTNLHTQAVPDVATQASQAKVETRTKQVLKLKQLDVFPDENSEKRQLKLL